MKIRSRKNNCREEEKDEKRKDKKDKKSFRSGLRRCKN